jgi:hypothetical protein
MRVAVREGKCHCGKLIVAWDGSFVGEPKNIEQPLTVAPKTGPNGKEILEWFDVSVPAQTGAFKIEKVFCLDGHETTLEEPRIV